MTRKRRPASTTKKAAEESKKNIPPGFTVDEWSRKQEVEAIEEVINEKVAAILNTVMDAITNIEIQKRYKHHLISDMLNCSHALIELAYLKRDTGTDLLKKDEWMNTDEPAPVPIDTWAPGSIPAIFVPQEEVLQPLKQAELSQSNRTESTVASTTAQHSARSSSQSAQVVDIQNSTPRKTEIHHVSSQHKHIEYSEQEGGTTRSSSSLMDEVSDVQMLGSDSTRIYDNEQKTLAIETRRRSKSAARRDVDSGVRKHEDNVKHPNGFRGKPSSADNSKRVRESLSAPLPTMQSRKPTPPELPPSHSAHVKSRHFIPKPPARPATKHQHEKDIQKPSSEAARLRVRRLHGVSLSFANDSQTTPFEGNTNTILPPIIPANREGLNTT